MANNIYGLTQLPEYDIKSGEQIGLETAGSAIQGAKAGSQLGSMFGPLGGAIGGVAGALGMGAASLIGGKARQKKDKAIKAGRDAQNRGISKLSNIKDFNQNLMTTQYEMGGESMSQHVGEIEKNELHYDKDYNLKTDAKGGPTHAEGGLDVQLKDKDVVFPTQDPADRSKIKSLVKRYKLNGDRTAKKALDKIKDSLPEKDPTGEVVTANKGVDVNIPTSSVWNMGDNNSDLLGRNLINYETSDTPVTPTLTNIEHPTNDSMTGAYITYASPVSGKGYEFQPDYGVSDKPIDLPDYEYEQRYGITDNYEFPESAEAPAEKPQGKGLNMNKLETGLGALSSTFNIMQNLKRGNEEIQGVERRFYQPDKYEYTDRSDRARKAAKESRTTQDEQLRGKGLSAGQRTGYGRAVARQYDDVRGRIEDRELQRRDKVQQLNTQQQNQAQQYNIQAGDRYDMTERRQLAARDKYTDTAMAETTQMGDIMSQRGWMKERNRKQYEMDEKTMPYIGTESYGYEKDADGNYVPVFKG